MANSHSANTIASRKSSPSSFLDSFLSDVPEPAPHASAPEDAKISDRSAFDKQNLSIEDIVSGLGVSSITNFPASQPAPASRIRPAMYPTSTQRESAIPLTPPKKFTGHSLASFPDKPQRSTSTPTRKQVQPTTYTTSTFSAFRRTMSSYAQARKRSISTTTPRAQRARHPWLKPARLEHNAAARTPAAAFAARRPTQMSPAELSKNPQYKRMSRQWVQLVVGIPFLLVTSYLLYRRLDQLDREEKVLGEVETKAERVRGVVPDGQVGRT